MAIKEQEPRMRPRYRDLVVLGLASPFSFFDMLVEVHLSESAEEADARALREDWDIVGECIWDAMQEHSILLESPDRHKHDRLRAEIQL